MRAGPWRVAVFLSLWRLSTDILTNTVGKDALLQVFIDYLEGNWGTAALRQVEWEGMKAVVRSLCMRLNIGVHRQLQQELRQEELEPERLQRHAAVDQSFQPEELRLRRSTAGKWSRLDPFMQTQFRHHLHREGDQHGRLLAWLLHRKMGVSRGPSSEG
ncbi:hypothetical protein NDU88_006607 [Pleurodeles waltl]|uniref:Uncharacterized protein n=1 Tax=Pleurodeles waltl TaxID=8319 RepID=A0AAV7WF57_PLEWA|nr:hypothetical protein NDU88_006607 [Pleurodeles waltl]